MSSYGQGRKLPASSSTQTGVLVEDPNSVDGVKWNTSNQTVPGTTTADNGKVFVVESGVAAKDVVGVAKFVATTSSDWTSTPPITIQSALDRIAAALNAAGHKA